MIVQETAKRIAATMKVAAPPVSSKANLIVQFSPSKGSKKTMGLESFNQFVETANCTKLAAVSLRNLVSSLEEEAKLLKETESFSFPTFTDRWLGEWMT